MFHPKVFVFYLEFVGYTYKKKILNRCFLDFIYVLWSDPDNLTGSDLKVRIRLRLRNTASLLMLKNKMGGSPTNGIETVRVYCQGVIGIIPENTYYSLPTSNKNNTLYLVPKYIFVWFPAIKHNVVHV